MLAERGQVDVVLERHRKAEGALELVGKRSPLEAGDVLGQAEHAGLALDDPRDADDDSVHAVGFEPGRLE